MTAVLFCTLVGERPDVAKSLRMEWELNGELYITFASFLSTSYSKPALGLVLEARN